MYAIFDNICRLVTDQLISIVRACIENESLVEFQETPNNLMAVSD